MKKTILFIIGLWATLAGAEDLPGLFGSHCTGFVDGAYFYDGNANPDSGQFNRFSLDQVEVDLERHLGERGLIRADIEYVNGADPQNAIDYLEQGYLQYSIPAGKKQVDVIFGKFNAPIGFELLDPVDMYQYSHSEIFTYGLPTNLTGIKGFIAFTDQVDLHAYLVNGWDNNTENNDGITAGMRLGLYPTKRIGIGLSAISGPEADGKEAKNRTVLDADLTFQPTDALLIGGEINIGSEDEAAVIDGQTKDASWSGFMAMGHYDFNSWLGLTGRLGSFSDDYGIRTGCPQSKTLTYTSITIAPTFKLGERMGCLLEVRFDSANEDVWLDGDGKATDARTTAALEATYSF